MDTGNGEIRRVFEERGYWKVRTLTGVKDPALQGRHPRLARVTMPRGIAVEEVEGSPEARIVHFTDAGQHSLRSLRVVGGQAQEVVEVSASPAFPGDPESKEIRDPGFVAPAGLALTEGGLLLADRGGHRLCLVRFEGGDRRSAQITVLAPLPGAGD